MPTQLTARDALRRLGTKEFSSAEERDAVLAAIENEDLRPPDLVWMLFRPDRVLRDAGVRFLQRRRELDIVDAFVAEGKGKPEPALRAAAAALFALNIPGIERRLAELLVQTSAKPSAEAKDIQAMARRLLLEATPTKTIEPLLWQLETAAPPEERSRYLERLALLPVDAANAARWQKAAADQEPQVRDVALQYLARNAAAQTAKLLAQALPAASYAAQQTIIDALSKLAATRGPEMTALVLPLIASGAPATRSAVLRILLHDPDRKRVIRDYIAFSKKLAGFVRDRAIDSLREFGSDLVEPAIELLADPDEDMRAAAVGLVAAFEDKRLVPALIPLLKDSDWWVRIAAAENLGRLGDPAAVDALVAALADPDVKWTAVEALGRLADPRALNPLGRLLADPQPNVRIEVIQALRNFRHPQVLQVLTTVATSDPQREVRTRALEIVEELSQRDHAAIDLAAMRSAAMSVRGTQGEPRLNTLLMATRTQGASDFHLAVGQPPVIRAAADLRRAQGDPWTAAQTEAMIREILSDAQWERVKRERQLDFCYYIPNGGRYRANVFLDHQGYSAVFRVIPDRPPTIADVGLPAHLAEIADYHQGLVLVCGPSGSGKSTTLAALVNLFNETRSDHVITMEDPIEFVHPFKNCLINQREVGSHTGSYARALRAALREDPDVIIIGELRDNDSISLALTAAETGHIVLGTLNSTSAAKAVDRLIVSFPSDEQGQIRAALSESLKFVIAQRLLPAREAHKQVACFEILKGTTTIANMIRDEKTFQIYSAMQIGRSQGMQTFDEGLKDLLQRQLITPETAYLAAQKKEDFESLVSAEFLGSAEL
jgi:twitching motility protein PilT